MDVFHAAKHGDLDVLEKYLNDGGNVEASSDNKTLLMLAAQADFEECIVAIYFRQI
jgi:hypothetical protein